MLCRVLTYPLKSVSLTHVQGGACAKERPGKTLISADLEALCEQKVQAKAEV